MADCPNERGRFDRHETLKGLRYAEWVVEGRRPVFLTVAVLAFDSA